MEANYLEKRNCESHTRQRFPRQLCKLKLNMNKYRPRICTNVHESCLHILKTAKANKKKKKKQK